MKAILFGAVLGVLLVWPAALSLTAAIVSAIATAVLSKPVLVAFTFGIAVRPYLTRRRWTA